jgi:hypothetical protein
MSLLHLSECIGAIQLVVVVLLVFESHLTQCVGMISHSTILAGKQDRKESPSSPMVLKKVGKNTGTPPVLVDMTREKTVGENDGTLPVLVDMTHGNVTWDHVNSVDKVADKDPKNQHEDTSSKLEETAASLSLGSHSKKVSNLVADKLRCRCNDVEAHLASINQEVASAISELEAQLATIIQELVSATLGLEGDYTKAQELTTENDSLQEKDQALNTETISLLEEKHKKISRSIQLRQQLLDELVQLLVCLRFFMP